MDRLLSNAQLRALRRSCLLVWRAAPRELGRLAALTLVMGAGPVAVLYLGKVVIDRVASLAGAGTTGEALGGMLSDPAVLAAVAGFVLVSVLLDSAGTLEAFEMASLSDRVQGHARLLLYGKVASFEDVSLFEDPERLDALQGAQQGIPRLQGLAVTLGNLMTGLFTFVPVFVLSFSIAWWVPLVVFATAVPSIVAQARYEEKGWHVEFAQAGRYRRMELNGRVLTGPEYAKEVRLFGLGPFFLSRWQELFRSAHGEVRKVRRRGALVVVGWSLLSGLGAGLPYAYVVASAVSGRFTLGDLALYAGLVFQVRSSLFVLVANAANLRDVALGSAAIHRLLDMEPTMKTVRTAGEAPGPGANGRTSREPAAPSDGPVGGIEVRGVSFSYPGARGRALEDVGLSIARGETVVVVGENGAGKTTLAKLLCRLYDPDEGEILWGGRDLRAFGLGALREKIAVVNQDHARFPATARENVAFGLLPEMGDEARVREAAEGAGIAGAIGRLPGGLDTPLTKQVEGGTDLSRGQWQRVAIARALMRSPQSELLILDEPTAALDARAEHEIFGILKGMAEGKMALVVSHRLALARDADRVVVMERGRVAETGTHEELMGAGGIYRSMFARQASSYVRRPS